MPIAKDISSIASRPGFVDDDIYRGYVKGIPGGQYHKGCLLQGFMTYKHLLKRIPQMKMREDDIVICSYPKSGTTWTEEIVSLIKNNGNVGKVKREIHWRVIHMETGRPFFHMRYMNNLKSRRLLATHLPFELLPTQLQNGRGKIIYVIRNPKDNAVSYYYHHKIACFLGPYTGNFQEFMTLYMRGQLLYGSWFDHVKSFWDQRDSDQILFIKYEDMKRDLRGAVRKIMHFMDRELSDDAIDQIVHHCSFAQMKDNPAVNRSKIPIPVFDLKEHRFMRKGIIGDWQNHFNQKQSDAMDEMYREKLASTGLELQWLPDELLKNESSEIDSNENYIKEVDNEGDNGVEATRL